MVLNGVMVKFSAPVTQDRFNATIFELLKMRFNGDVAVTGNWDAYDTLEYLENRFRVCIIPTLTSDGSAFRFRDKLVVFYDDAVLVSSDVS
jgi:hypothetical protein